MANPYLKRKRDMKKEIEMYKSNYSKNDLKSQVEVLHFMADLAVQCKLEGYTKDEVIDELCKFSYNFILSIANPNSNKFYIDRTIEYLNGKEDWLKKHLVSYVLEKRNYNEVLKNSCSENLSENIDFIIAYFIRDFMGMPFIKSEKIKKLKVKISENTLDFYDIDELYFIILGFLKEAGHDSRNKSYKRIEENPELIYDILIKKMNDIFEVKEMFQNQNEVEIPMKKDNKVDLYKISNCENQVKNSKKVDVKDFIEYPFYGKNEKNDNAIFISELLNNISNVSNDKMYQIIEASKDSTATKEIVIKLIKQYAASIKKDKLKPLLCERILRITTLLRDSSFLKIYNSANNKNLEQVGLEYIQINEEDLMKIFEDLNANTLLSTESLVAMSAFYVNRLTKIIEYYSRSVFILDKAGFIDKIYSDAEDKSIEIDEEDITSYMAQYDFWSNISSYLQYIQESTGKMISNERINNYLEQYREEYENEYGNFEKDVENEFRSQSYKKYYYMIKDQSMSQLVYTALTSDKNSLLNWGIVQDRTAKDSTRDLLGFDIKYMNMPLFLHIDHDKLLEIVANSTNDTVIPVYEGATDMNAIKSPKSRITNQVYFPLNAKQRKTLKKNYSSENRNRDSLFLNHIALLQDKRLSKVIFEPGNRIYDLKTRKVKKSNSVQTDTIKKDER